MSTVEPETSKSMDGKEKRCLFCIRGEVNEDIAGKLISKAGITAHYFCMLFSSGLSQQGKSEKHGILGFLPEDIKQEVRRGSRLRCNYCKMLGATIGCVVKNCKKMFHLCCGRENETMHQFFDTFSSFCKNHRPQQDVPSDDDPNIVCSICMNTVKATPSNDTLRAPCCRNYWYHRECIQRYASSAGLYFFKCPLCNNKDEFQTEMLTYGTYIPDQDASWETEPHAFQELLERYSHCDAIVCKCVEGRDYDKDDSKWEIILCDFCGSHGSHMACDHLLKHGRNHICPDCNEVDKKARQEQTLMKSPMKRMSLEQLQLELASTSASSKCGSSYPGPSGALRKKALPKFQDTDSDINIPNTNRASTNRSRRKRMSDTAEKSPVSPKLKRLDMSRERSSRHTRLHNFLTPSTSSDTSDDECYGHNSVQQSFKHSGSFAQKNKINMCTSSRIRNMQKQKHHNAVCSTSNGAKKVIAAKELLASNERKQKRRLKDAEKDKMLTNNCYSVTRTNKGNTGHNKGISNQKQSVGTFKSSEHIRPQGQNVNKKKSTLKLDKNQTTLTQWLKCNSSSEKSLENTPKHSEKLSISKKSSLTELSTSYIIEWKGKQLFIKSHRVIPRNNRNIGCLNPKNLEIDMNGSRGSSDWNKEVNVLVNIDSEVRVTRQMHEMEHNELLVNDESVNPSEAVDLNSKGSEIYIQKPQPLEIVMKDSEDNSEQNNNAEELTNINNEVCVATDAFEIEKMEVASVKVMETKNVKQFETEGKTNIPSKFSEVSRNELAKEMKQSGNIFDMISNETENEMEQIIQYKNVCTKKDMTKVDSPARNLRKKQKLLNIMIEENTNVNCLQSGSPELTLKLHSPTKEPHDQLHFIVLKDKYLKNGRFPYNDTSTRANATLVEEAFDYSDNEKSRNVLVAPRDLDKCTVAECENSDKRQCNFIPTNSSATNLRKRIQNGSDRDQEALVKGKSSSKDSCEHVSEKVVNKYALLETVKFGETVSGHIHTQPDSPAKNLRKRNRNETTPNKVLEAKSDTPNKRFVTNLRNDSNIDILKSLTTLLTKNVETAQNKSPLKVQKKEMNNSNCNSHKNIESSKSSSVITNYFTREAKCVLEGTRQLDGDDNMAAPPTYKQLMDNIISNRFDNTSPDLQHSALCSCSEECVGFGGLSRGQSTGSRNSHTADILSSKDAMVHSSLLCWGQFSPAPKFKEMCNASVSPSSKLGKLRGACSQLEDRDSMRSKASASNNQNCTNTNHSTLTTWLPCNGTELDKQKTLKQTANAEPNGHNAKDLKNSSFVCKKGHISDKTLMAEYYGSSSHGS